MFEIIEDRTPAEEGFRMPAEWEKHDSCWMAWPKSATAWKEYHEIAKRAVSLLANIISEFEPVKMIVSEESFIEAGRFCGNGVELVQLPADDAWTRDTCPTFITKGKELAAVDWKFNGWGFLDNEHWTDDYKLAENVSRKISVPCFKAPIVNEGGAIHTDGEGTLLCTRATIQGKNRNPALNERKITEILRAYLGVKKVIWLDEGYDQDETGGHIDVISAFTGPGKIMHLYTDDKKDLNYPVFKENIETLENTTDATGRKLKVIKVPQPSSKYYGKIRLSLSYANYYTANGAVILPLFNDRNDSIALDMFKDMYPHREIIGIQEASTIFYGGGGIHCVTQQQPSIL